MRKITRTQGPSLAVAMLALFVALGGIATAAAVVPLAKRAMVADNAKKLGGKSLTQMTAASAAQAQAAAKQAATAAAELPGPASTVAGLVTVKTASWSFGPNGEGDVTVTCDANQKAIAGGWEDPAGWGHAWDSRPTPDGAGWKTYITISTSAPNQQTGTVYAVCIK
jgi:hypothetical protein